MCRFSMYWRFPFIALVLTMLAACSGSAPGQRSIKDIKAAGTLVVGTSNSPFGMFEGPEQTQGWEYSLITNFAKHLGVKARFKTADSPKELIAMLKRGDIDIAASTLTVSEHRLGDELLGVPYWKTQDTLVCRRGIALPKTPPDMVGLNIAITPGSSFEQSLVALKQQIPNLRWTVSEDDTEKLLHSVDRRKLDCTVTDEFVYRLYRRYFPSIRRSLQLSQSKDIGWLINHKDSELAEVSQEWMQQFKQSERYQTLENTYIGLAEQFDYVDQRTFHRRIEQRLPKYQNWFEDAAKQHDIPWTLLAAQSYQESHWNPKAKSPTGVRGIMMLTQNTAKSVGVTNRLDAKSNIFGGAKYLAKMTKRVPKAVQGSDRLWFALAAYNVGMGHMHDAQTLARKLGKDPNRWIELKEVLPLLTQKKYYKSLKYGYARGHEPVRYVDNIRNYRDILEKALHYQVALDID